MYLQDLETLSSISSLIDQFKGNIGGIKNAVSGIISTVKGLSGTSVLPVAAAIGSVAAVVKTVNFAQAWATGELAVEKYGEAIKASQGKLQEINTTSSAYKDALNSNLSKVTELQNAYGDGTITAAQKEELGNLQLQNALLEEKIAKLDEVKTKETSEAANAAKDQFNTEFGSVSDKSGEFLKGYNNNLGAANVVAMLANVDDADGIEQLNIIKYLTDEIKNAQTQLDEYRAGSQSLTQEQAADLEENLKYYKDGLEISQESFAKNSENLYNHLQQQKSVLMDSMNSDGSFQEDADGSKKAAFEQMKAWEQVFQTYVDEYKTAAEKVAKEAEKAPNPTEEQPGSKQDIKDLSVLESQAGLLSQIQDELRKNGQISAAAMNTMLNTYPQLNAALEKYMSGLISEQDLFQELQICYENDRTSYVNALIVKNSQDETFFNNLKTAYPDLFNQLAAVYGNDVYNWNSLAAAKLKITNDLLSKMQKNWGNYFMAIGDEETGYELVRTATFDDSDLYDHSMTQEEWLNSETFKTALDQYNRPAEPYLAQAQKDIDFANEMLKQLNQAAYDTVQSTIDTSWQGLSGTQGANSAVSEARNAFSEEIDWFDRLTGKLSKILSRFQGIWDNASKNWTDRFDALGSAMANIHEQIQAQSAAYEDYMSRFDSFDLDSRYKERIANGQIGTETITDETLKKAIDECITLYDHARQCEDALEELNKQLSDFAKQKFDNTAAQFEEILGKMEAVTTQLSNEADLLEAKGYMASSTLYDALLNQENKNFEQLHKERQSLVAALESALNSGAVERYSENWYAMQAAIDEVSGAIQDSQKALVEYNNELRQLSWDAFDFTRDQVTNLVDETEFLVELLKNAGTTDTGGNLNENGEAVQTLLAQKYELYLKQAQDYGAEIAKINAEIAGDPYNTSLLQRRQELTKAQQDAILAAQGEKDAIKDLLSDAYEAYENNLSKIINRYKDLMRTLQDTWNYEKTISEKTKNLAVLQKQYAAYQGDTSQEGQKNVQQLKEQIQEAKADLEQTEYDRLIADTEKLLDAVSTDTKDYLNQRLEELDVLLENILNQNSADLAAVSDTISNTVKAAGYTLSVDMKSIWDAGEHYRTSLQKTIESIKEFTAQMLENSNRQAADAAQDIENQQSGQGARDPVSGSDSGGIGENGADAGYEPESAVGWIHSPDYYPKDRLNIETSVIDRLKWHDFDASFDARSQYYRQMGGDGTYYATYGQNVWMLNWMKSNGYQNGTKRLTGARNGYAWTQDGGPELIRKSDGAVLSPVGNGGTIFNTRMTDNLWNWGQINPLTPPWSSGFLSEASYASARGNTASIHSTISGGIHIDLPNVTNYDDFCRQAQKDPKFEKMVQAMTLEQTLGKNTFNKLQF